MSITCVPLPYGDLALNLKLPVFLYIVYIIILIPSALSFVSGGADTD